MKKIILLPLLFVLILFLVSCESRTDKIALEMIQKTNSTWKDIYKDIDRVIILDYQQAIGIKENQEKVSVLRFIGGKYPSKFFFEKEKGAWRTIEFTSDEYIVYFDCNEYLECRNITKTQNTKLESLIDLSGEKYAYLLIRDDQTIVFYLIDKGDTFLVSYNFFEDSHKLKETLFFREQEEKLAEAMTVAKEKAETNYKLSSIYSKKDKNEVKLRKFENFTYTNIIETTQLGLELGLLRSNLYSINNTWYQYKDLDDVSLDEKIKEKTEAVKVAISNRENKENSPVLPLFEVNEKTKSFEEFQASLEFLKNSYVVDEIYLQKELSIDESKLSKLLRLSALEKRG